MYRICKVLNHNGVIALDMNDSKEYVLLGKGVGFGKKPGERFEQPADCTVYSLQETSSRGDAAELIKSIQPEYFQMANRILNEAERHFGKIDRSILFPMADHIAFAVQRLQKGEKISNPLTEDIKTLFHSEFKVASMIQTILKEEKQIDIDEDEIGYVALHIHSALEKESVSVSMQMARAVRDCVSVIEEQRGIRINVMSLSYNRLMNHVKYMVARVLKGESLKVNMNDYVQHNFPDAFELATTVCDHLSHALHKPLEELEIGYLAMHIERIRHLCTERAIQYAVSVHFFSFFWEKRTKVDKKILEKRTKTVEKVLEKRTKAGEKVLEKRTKAAKKVLEKRTNILAG